MNELVAQVEHAIVRRKLLPDRAGVVVAVSGGADSVALLHLLHELAPRHRWRLVVAHFNHQLRGPASDADEAFVLAEARRLDLPGVAGAGEVAAHATQDGLSIEMAARELRHHFFVQCARDAGCHWVALAHHADDQVELFFLRLLRGAGIEGLAGMNWSNPSPANERRGRPVQLIRPLLEVSRQQLEEWLTSRGLSFCHDASNDSAEILRNRLRHRLLPLLRREFQPALDQVILRTMDLVRAEGAGLADQVAAWLAQPAAERAAFADLSPAVQRRVLQQQLLRAGLAVDFDLVEHLRTRAGCAITAPGGTLVARSDAGTLVLPGRSPSFRAGELVCDLTSARGQAIFEALRVAWVRTPGRRRPAAHPGTEFFDADCVGPQVVLRHWRPGDRFQPIGLEQPVKLQNWFTKRKVPRAERHWRVVATTTAGEIFWVEGERLGERFKLTARTKSRLRWTWQRE